MWALNAAPIRNGEVRRLLTRYRKENGFQSDLWVLPRHLALLGVRDAYRPKLLLPTASLLAEPPRAMPFSLLPKHTQRRLLSEHPPPMMPPGHFSLLERTPAATQWRPATVEECFDAAFLQAGSTPGANHLLCEPTFTACLAVPDEVGVLNAQETSNPFLLDPSLCHRDLVTAAPFGDSVSSSLTTIAAQFHYTSLRWLHAGDVAAAGLQVRNAAQPHRVSHASTLSLVHVSQLPMGRQEELVDAVPRYVLLKSTTMSYVYHKNQWRHFKALRLAGCLDVRTAPPLRDGEENPTPLLLWVSVTPADAYTGSAVECQRTLYSNVYNSEQLC